MNFVHTLWLRDKILSLEQIIFHLQIGVFVAMPKSTVTDESFLEVLPV